MAQLGIKVDDSIKQAFIDLGFELDLTQPQLIERLLQVHEQLGVPVNESDTLKDLQKKLDSNVLVMEMNQSKIAELAGINKALQTKLDAEKLATDSKIDGLANDNKALQDLLALSEKKVQELAKPSDLTADIKEYSDTAKLRKGVHLYVQQRARVALRSAKSITEDQAVKLFIESYNEAA
jgi:hypothetical protein